MIVSDGIEADSIDFICLGSRNCSHRPRNSDVL